MLKPSLPQLNMFPVDFCSFFTNKEQSLSGIRIRLVPESRMAFQTVLEDIEFDPYVNAVRGKVHHLEKSEAVTAQCQVRVPSQAESSMKPNYISDSRSKSVNLKLATGSVKDPQSISFCMKEGPFEGLEGPKPTTPLKVPRPDAAVITKKSNPSTQSIPVSSNPRQTLSLPIYPLKEAEPQYSAVLEYCVEFTKVSDQLQLK